MDPLAIRVQKFCHSSGFSPGLVSFGFVLLVPHTSKLAGSRSGASFALVSPSSVAIVAPMAGVTMMPAQSVLKFRYFDGCAESIELRASSKNGLSAVVPAPGTALTPSTGSLNLRMFSDGATWAPTDAKRELLICCAEFRPPVAPVNPTKKVFPPPSTCWADGIANVLL